MSNSFSFEAERGLGKELRLFRCRAKKVRFCRMSWISWNMVSLLDGGDKVYEEYFLI
jgi:hypothetical protein